MESLCKMYFNQNVRKGSKLLYIKKEMENILRLGMKNQNKARIHKTEGTGLKISYSVVLFVRNS